MANNGFTKNLYNIVQSKTAEINCLEETKVGPTRPKHHRRHDKKSWSVWLSTNTLRKPKRQLVNNRQKKQETTQQVYEQILGEKDDKNHHLNYKSHTLSLKDRNEGKMLVDLILFSLQLQKIIFSV